MMLTMIDMRDVYGVGLDVDRAISRMASTVGIADRTIINGRAIG